MTKLHLSTQPQSNFIEEIYRKRKQLHKSQAIQRAKTRMQVSIKALLGALSKAQLWHLANERQQEDFVQKEKHI